MLPLLLLLLLLGLGLLWRGQPMAVRSGSGRAASRVAAASLSPQAAGPDRILVGERVGVAVGVCVEQRGQAEHRPGGQMDGELDVDVETSGVDRGGDVAAGVGDQPAGVGHQLGDAGVDQYLAQEPG
jgi:hypothetical protein